MKERKTLGKIIEVRYGFGGYQEVEFGAGFTLGTKVVQVRDFWGMWSDAPSDNAEWTREEQLKTFGGIVHRILDLMNDAKVREFHDLIDTPIEITYDGNILKSWKVLTEVL